MTNGEWYKRLSAKQDGGCDFMGVRLRWSERIAHLIEYTADCVRSVLLLTFRYSAACCSNNLVYR
jgi:hypothetical protein